MMREVNAAEKVGTNVQTDATAQIDTVEQVDATAQTNTAQLVNATKRLGKSPHLLVELYNVNKSFGKQEVLRDVDLDLAPGRILGLVGPSGGGKTTLVNIITGLHRADAGMVKVLGEVPPLRHTRSQLGYMPQSEALYNDLTANENLRFFGSLYGMKRRALDEALLRVLEFVRLDKTGRKVVASFSGGMKRRLSLAIALLHSPRLLVLDEPTIGLDPEHRVSLWQGFRELAVSGTGLLITTHSMDEAANCDEIAMLRNGSIIARGTPNELIARAKAQTLEEAFLVFGTSVDQPGSVTQANPDPMINPNPAINPAPTTPGASSKEGATHA